MSLQRITPKTRGRTNKSYRTATSWWALTLRDPVLGTSMAYERLINVRRSFLQSRDTGHNSDMADIAYLRGLLGVHPDFPKKVS